VLAWNRRHVSATASYAMKLSGWAPWNGGTHQHQNTGSAPGAAADNSRKLRNHATALRPGLGKMHPTAGGLDRSQDPSRHSHCVLLFAAVPALLWVARRAFIAFLMAIFFAYLLEPAVAWFTRRLKGRRIYGIAAAYAVLLIGLVVFGVTLGPKIANELCDFL